MNIHVTEPQPGELEMIQAEGFRWVRMDFSWAATEPEDVDAFAADVRAVLG